MLNIECDKSILCVCLCISVCLCVRVCVYSFTTLFRLHHIFYDFPQKQPISHLSSFLSGQAADSKQEGVGGHQEDPLSPILGEEGPGDGGCLPSRVTDSRVGESQCHHSSGGPGDHGPTDGGVTTFWPPTSCFGFFLFSLKLPDKAHTLPCSVLRT